MKILAISGSLRRASTNTALLHGLAQSAGGMSGRACRVEVFAGLGALPLFSPDHEGSATPAVVRDFAAKVAAADALVFSVPEYVRALPGGVKNAIDWLVARDEIIAKPVAILHGSHRGEDALHSLRLVLGTVSQAFLPEIFERFELIGKSPEEVRAYLRQPEQAARLEGFAQRLCAAISPVSAPLR
ncbi:MAG TPA: NAD(P)H-dependent oxidoreductase [Aliiroseovarius sp.]|nr:NAD(P)H-dependent oxidoreductase [Aliiroseovarius sp.]